MIPIVIGYVGAGGGSFRSRVFSALSYVTGLSLVYALLGVIAAATGNMFGELTASAPIYVAFGVFILAMGGAMMDWFAVPMPKFLLPKAGGEERGTSLLRPFFVGASSGIVASPCTAPVMGGILVYIASERHYLKGAMLMLAFAAGMNTLLLALGLFAGFIGSRPRSGAWMIWVKKLLAAFLLAGGLYFIYRAGQIS